MMSDPKQNQKLNPLKPLAKCPTCGAPADATARPFCSSRCADIDLGNWFQGKYATPLIDAADDTIIEALHAGGMAPPQDGDDC